MADAAAGHPVLQELDVDALAKRLFDLGEALARCTTVCLSMSVLLPIRRTGARQTPLDRVRAACVCRSVGEHGCEEPPSAVQREQGAAQVQAQAAEACAYES
jgi:hypothetical protein